MRSEAGSSWLGSLQYGTHCNSIDTDSAAILFYFKFDMPNKTFEL